MRLTHLKFGAIFEVFLHSALCCIASTGFEPMSSRPFMEVGRDTLALLPFNAVLPNH